METPLTLDRTGAERWVGEHGRWLHRRCCRQLAGFSQAQVEEIAQDVWVVAWCHLRRQACPEDRLRPFLAQIALHLCRNARRKRKDVLFADGEPPDTACLAPSPHDRAEQAQQARQVSALMGELLDPLDQEIVWLRFGCDLPFTEIASHQGLSDTDTVRVALQRIKRKLGPALTRSVCAF